MNAEPVRVHVLTLGGTIAMTARDAGQGVVPALDAADLLASLPAAPAGVHLSHGDFRRLPGAHLTLPDVVDLRAEIDRSAARGCDGVVVTQGTDTLEETAFALDLLGGGDTPVVVTGALRHPGRPGTDGPANLLDAVRVAASEAAVGTGVTVVFNGEVHSARYVQKRHTERPSAFASPGLGPLGWVTEDRVRIPLRPARVPPLPLPAPAGPAPVALVTAVLGDDVRLLPHLPDLGYEGAVLAGFGAGHLPNRTVADAEALAARIPVVLASRTGAGELYRNTYDFPGSERDLLARGLIGAGAVSPLKARVLLSLALGAGLSREAVAAACDALSA
ncbi:asparaginase [Streptomyces aculeolatus]|uniref:asparaginase n=1 Tax=Streptomyces aculeolatus TaxID=270689 RepID=UPI001CEC6639|nr:asparaginase [Streptomyces aculeolatus]